MKHGKKGSAMTGTSSWTVTLADAALLGVASVGAKAATLSELARAGFAVPEGIVITTEALRSVLGTLGPAPDPSVIRRARLPEGLNDAIGEIVRAMPDAVLAVRSSAVAEDRGDASFAGMYDSVLGVRGVEALRAAVLVCWASAFGARIGAYGGEASAQLAVLVQRQVQPSVAGVAFTANPVSGARDEVIIHAVPEQGDAVVHGTVDPDEWVVAGDVARAVDARGGTLTADQARLLAVLARRIEAERGAPQDIEWAFADGQATVLQARPISALPVAPREELPAGRTWTKEGERYAEPFTALGASIAPELIGTGLTAAFTAYGALIDRVDVRSIGGELYLAMATPGRPGTPPPWWVLAALARVQPGLRRRCAQARRMTARTRLDAVIRRWHDEWGPECDTESARLRSRPLRELADAELVRHLDEVLAAARRAMDIHFRLTVPVAVRQYALITECASVLGWPAAAALDLVGGTSPASAAPARALRERAAELTADERRAIGGLQPGRVLGELGRVAPEYAAWFAGWCDRFAFRGLDDDPGSPVLWERPALLERLIVDSLGDPVRAADPAARASDARQRARRQLADADPVTRERFDVVVRDALDAYGVRDDVALRTGAVFGGLVRLTALEIGSRLVDRGEPGRREDAAQLDVDTLRRALVETPNGRLRVAVAHALGERAWVRRHPGPERVGPPAVAPDLRGFPRSARIVNSALLWMRAPAGADAGPPTKATGAHATVHGVGAAPGRFTGPVRVLTGSDDIATLRAGEVLVCATADPAWSVLFGTAGALVTDHGGLLSHAAIIARENGIPAVLAVGTATSTLRTGQIVTVDGSAGQVEIDAPSGEE